jgi:hypothetical protein
MSRSKSPRIGLCCIVFAHVCRSFAQTIDFDPPLFASGQIVTTVGDVTFLDFPVVFTPAPIATFSPPNAVHFSLACNDPSCSNGAYMLRMNFAKPMSSVSLRTGSDAAIIPNLCIPEGSACAINARLVGYDSLQPPITVLPQGKLRDAQISAPLGTHGSSRGAVALHRPQCLTALPRA